MVEPAAPPPTADPAPAGRAARRFSVSRVLENDGLAIVGELPAVLAPLAAAAVWVLALASPAVVGADSGAPVEKRSYLSSNRQFELTVDPRWLPEYERMRPLLTLARASGEVLWSRGPEGFEGFDFPMHVAVGGDGRHLVFGGYSVHNVSWDTGHREGLRFYDGGGRLIRFVSRRDLPAGQYSVSTAHWHDAERTRIEAGRLIFFTPGREAPLEFELATGRLLAGALIAGQGDDEKNWREQLLRRMRREEPDE